MRQVFNYNMLIKKTLKKDPQREYHEEMQKVMWELKLKTDKFMKRLKKETGESRFRHDVIK